MSLKSSGKIDASKVVEHVCLTNTEDAPRVRKLCGNSDTIVGGYTPDTALALFVSAKLTMDQYNLLRDSARQIGFNLYPSYFQIQKAKKDCYPTTKTVTETGATVNLQELLDHTFKRICKTITNLPPKSDNLVLVCKWGCDGASGHGQYKQALAEKDDINSSIFFQFGATATVQ
jgi:hypothetical protein